MQLKIAATQSDDHINLVCLSPVSSGLASWVPGGCVTLQDLVDGEEVLKPKERRILGVVLAHSLLHLLDGPWLPQSWTGKSISFYHASGGNKRFPNFRRPYVSTFLAPAGVDVSSNTGYNAHPMPGMVTLGKILLELERKDTIVPPDFSQNSTSDFVQAKLLLERLEDWARDLQAMDLFIEAIGKCLDMSTYPNNLQRPELMWNIYGKVIYPLEQELLRMCGSSAVIQGSQATLEDLEALFSGIPLDQPMRLNGGIESGQYSRNATRSTQATPNELLELYVLNPHRFDAMMRLC